MLLWTLGCMYLFKLDIYPGVEMLGHKVVLFLAFWETSILFSTVAAPIHIPINSVKGFPFFTSLPTFLIWVLFDNSHSNCWEMTNPWSIISFTSIFSHSIGCLSFLPMVSFTVQKLLRLIKGSHLFFFCLFVCFSFFGFRW